MTRALLPLALLALAACAKKDETPERPDEQASARLATIEERLDAAEAADPTLPAASKEKGPDTEVPDPNSTD